MAFQKKNIIRVPTTPVKPGIPIKPEKSLKFNECQGKVRDIVLKLLIVREKSGKILLGQLVAQVTVKIDAF